MKNQTRINRIQKSKVEVRPIPKELKDSTAVIEIKSVEPRLVGNVEVTNIKETRDNK